MFHPDGPHLLMHLAAIISVAALALRDQLKLRLVLLVSIILNGLYNYSQAPPAYQDLFWNFVTLAMNIFVIVQIILDRTVIGMSAEEAELFAAFEMLTPGEFRAIIKLGAWHTAESEVAITQEGKRPGSLFYVLRGGIDIGKAQRHFSVSAHTFIGEIAFLHRTPASATVTLAQGSRYFEWPLASLEARLEGREPLRHALTRLLSFDMAMKVARA